MHELPLGGGHFGMRPAITGNVSLHKRKRVERTLLKGATIGHIANILGNTFRVVMTPDQFKSEMIALLPRLRRFALSLTRSGPDADDLLQEACTAALQKWQQYDPAQPFDRWMFRVVRNLWVSEIRKRQVRQGQGQVDAQEAPELHAVGSADETLEAKQIRRKVTDLGEELSQPLLLVCAEGYSYREVADLLGIPVGTVMSRIHRARKQLISGLVSEGAGAS